MIRLTLFSLICNIFIAEKSLAQPSFYIDAEMRNAYQKALMLDLAEAYNIIKEYKNPNNYARILIHDFCNFVMLFVYEKKEDYDKLKVQKKLRLETIRKSGLEEQWRNFIQAEILLHWALIQLKNNDNFQAFSDVKEAIDLLEYNKKKYGNFIYTYKSIGIVHALLGTIPGEFGWISRLAGYEGSINLGKNEIRKFIDYAEPGNDIFLTEALASLALINSYLENKTQEAAAFWKNKKLNTQEGPLLKMLSIRILQRGADAESVRIITDNLTNKEKIQFPLLYYLSGLQKLQNLDIAGSNELIIFLSKHQGINYIKEAWQKVAWSKLLSGDREGYKKCMDRCLDQGYLITDEDKAAYLDASKHVEPDIYLLKARLLFDGGHYTRGYHLLSTRPLDSFHPEDLPEYRYRMGRICQLLEQNNEAISYYRDIIDGAYQENKDFQCQAILFTGNILEKEGKQIEACMYYKKVLRMDPPQYGRSLHHKAMSGLDRLGCTK